MTKKTFLLVIHKNESIYNNGKNTMLYKDWLFSPVTQMGGLSVDACTHKVNSDMLINYSDCRGLLPC